MAENSISDRDSDEFERWYALTLAESGVSECANGAAVVAALAAPVLAATA